MRRYLTRGNDAPVVHHELIHQIDKMILRGEPRDAMLKFIAEQLAASYGYPLVQVSLKGTAGHVEIRTAAAA